MSESSISELYSVLKSSKVISYSQERLNNIIMRAELDQLTSKKNFEKILAIQNAFDKCSINDHNSNNHLDILHLIYARISNESSAKRNKYVNKILELLKLNSTRFSEAINDLVISDCKSAERFVKLTNKIADKLDSLDSNTLNAYLQNAMNSEGISLETQFGKKTLNEILTKNNKVTLKTQELANKLLNFSDPEIKNLNKKRIEELRGFRLVNVMLGLGALLALVGIMTGIIAANMMLAVGSLFLFISFWGAGHFNRSTHDIQMRGLSKAKGKLFLFDQVKKNNKPNDKRKKINSLRKLIRANHIKFEKNIAKYEKSILKDPRKSYN